MKRLTLIIACFILLLTCQSVANAEGNTGRTYWKNEYRVWSPFDHTPARKKMNKSYYYNRTYGHKNETSSMISKMLIWAALYDGRDVSGDHYYPVGRNEEAFLYNLAVENYGSGVAVRIDSRSAS
ncbi:hypothetical protein, partial [Mammaliicoccus sciuri]|uniref:hypothetical protein n=1 Tax=Mammaliicoccus sciuri TaxID=1296 RepID=UPI00227002DE